MIATFVAALLLIGSAYCRSLPPQEIIQDINETLNGNAALIRNTRQSGANGK